VSGEVNQEDMNSQGDIAEDLMVEGSETAQAPVINATKNIIPGFLNEIVSVVSVIGFTYRFSLMGIPF
jgi:hypothetical protein